MRRLGGSRRLPRRLAGVAAAAVLATAAGATAGSAAASPSAASPKPAWATSTASGGEAATAAVLAVGSRTYSVNTYADQVIRWNPCEPVHYRVNLSQAAPGAWTDLQKALYELHKRTGLTFWYDGQTSVIPQSGYGADTVGDDKPAPLVIAWAKPGTGKGRSNLLLGGSNSGQGGWQAYGWTDGDGAHALRIRTGYVVLDSTKNRLYRAGFGSGQTRGELLLHELGHAVGLNHASSSSQIMYPQTLWRSSTRYGTGDLYGLAKVGASHGCLR
ncbi:MAG: matrixin family metalloprotease [Actinomycetes bacterium]